MSPFLFAVLFFLLTPLQAFAHQQIPSAYVTYFPLQQPVVMHVPTTPSISEQPHITMQKTFQVTTKPQTHTKPTNIQPPAPTVTPPPQPAPAAPTATAPTNFVSQVAADVFADTNEQRRLNGLSPLALNATVGSIARAHSSDMLANNYFAHNDLSGCSPSCRLTNAGYDWQAMGENIYEMSGYNLDAAGTANQIVQGWMNSPEHKANILNGSYTQTGVGIAVQGSTVYATSDYAEPRSN